MKNKDGFTLVELLAVIVIMGILMLVGIPQMRKVIENSRKDTFLNEVKTVRQEAENIFTSESGAAYGGDGLEKEYYDTGIGEISDPSLFTNKPTGLRYFVRLDETGRVTHLYVWNDKYTYSFTKATGIKVEDIIRGNIIKTEKNKYDLAISDIHTVFGLPNL